MSWFSDFISVLKAPARSLLSYAVRKDMPDLARFAIRLSDNTNYVDPATGDTFLHKCSSLSMARVLLAHRANLEVLNNHHETPLLTKIKAHQFTLACELILHGARLNVLDDQGNPPLHYLLSHSPHIPNILETFINNVFRPDIFNAVIHNPHFVNPRDTADINAANSVGDSPVHIAVRNNLNHALRQMSERQVIDIDLRNQAGKTPVDELATKIAAEDDRSVEKAREFADLACALFSRQLRVQPQQSDHANESFLRAHGFSLLHYVVRNCTHDVLRLIVRPENVNSVDWLNKTALHHAAEQGNVAAAKALLENGADVHLTDYRGFPPLAYAANSTVNSAEMMDLLIAKGADPKQKIPENEPTIANREVTLLHVVARTTGFVQAIANLMKRGAKPNAKDAASVLWNSDAGGLRQFVYVNPFTSHTGRTPLHYAADYPENIAALLAHGADKDRKDDHGRTALDYAQAIPNASSVAVLNTHSAQNKGILHALGLTPLRAFAVGATTLATGLGIKHRNALQ